MTMLPDGKSPGMAESFTRENLDEILRELGKVFRRLNGTKTPAELILVGGAAIIASFRFRESTTDIDALIQASSAMRDAIHQVGDRHGFPQDWLNQDFRMTASYSDRIAQYSVPYRTFSNVLHVRTLPAAYVAAMKLASLRQYKYDRSDVIGIIRESRIVREQIEHAVCDLYGSFDSLGHVAWAEKLLDEIYATDDLDALYAQYRAEETEDFSILRRLDQEQGEQLTRDNVDDVIAAARAKLGL